MNYNVDMMIKWADALESGNYKQGKESLHPFNEVTMEYQHCCLGVACELFAKQAGMDRVGQDGWAWGSHTSWKVIPESLSLLMFGHADLGNPDLYVPKELWEFRAAVHENLAWDPNRKVLAAYLNDTWGLTFQQIAQCIRYTVERMGADAKG